MSNQTINEFVRENKTVLIVIMIGLFLVELEIFAFSIMKSGRKSWLQVMNNNGEVIHEIDGSNLSEFNKYYFERTFGPFKNYEVKLNIQDKPFPFRAWFVASLGVPIGIVLLLSFIFKVYLSLFNKEEIQHNNGKMQAYSSSNIGKLDTVLNKMSNMNIFAIGLFVFIAVISYWIIPDTINYVGKVGVDVIARFKWFLLFIIISVILVGMWIIHLRYRLAKNNIESWVEIEKYKLKLKSDNSFSLLETNDFDKNSNMIKKL